MLNFTEQDLNNLKDALKSGATTVTIGNRSMTYRSLDDILKLIKLIENNINDTASESTTNVVSGFSRKGENNE